MTFRVQYYDRIVLAWHEVPKREYRTESSAREGARKLVEKGEIGPTEKLRVVEVGDGRPVYSREFYP